MLLLAARQHIPHHISYAIYTPTAPNVADLFEHARVNRPPHTLASPDLCHDPALYLFSLDDTPLASLSFPGLALADSGAHTPASIQAHTLLLSHFYHAYRAQLVSDLVAASASSSHSRKLRAFKNGVLISQSSAGCSDWEYKSIARPLVFCQLQIILNQQHVLVHPLLISTPFLDISACLPLPPGAPITLLPYGTPAYFLATYTGPTAALIKQFQASLSGLGAGDWQNDPFIIAYIKVENKQGEDKGITIIYPSKLCVSTIPGSSPARPPLQYIPELPAPLQPSPEVAPTLPSASGVLNASTPDPQPRRPSIFSSPTSESLHAFRALNLSKTNDLRQVAVEVGGYVDAVARERERERERLRRERDGIAVGTSPKLSRPAPPTPLNTTDSTPQRMPSMSAVPGPSSASTPYPPVVPPLLPAPQMQMQPSHSQSFYPSPPQTVPSHPPPSEHITSPVVENPPPSAVDPPPSAHDVPPPSAVAPPQPTQDTRFDSYMMDQSAWASAQVGSGGFMPMGDMDMDFMGMDMGGMDMGGMEGVDLSGMGMGMNLGDMNLSMGDGFGNMDMGMNMNMMDMGYGLGGQQAAETPTAHKSTTTGATQPVPTAAPPPPAHAHAPVSAPIAVARTSGRTGGTTARMDLDDDSDDDFSFFDRPAAAPPPPPPPVTRGSSGSLGHDFAGVDGATHNGQIWTPGAFLDTFAPTPGAADAHHHHHQRGASGDLAPPDLMPSSPGSTPADSHSHSAPATPAAGLHLAYETSVLVKRVDSGQSASSAGGSLASSGRFEPIPFASYHRRADGKYFAGKFAALPSPPPDSPGLASRDAASSAPLSSSVPSSSAAGTTSSNSANMGYFYQRPPASSVHAAGGSLPSFSSLPTSPGRVGGNGWRLRYNAQTDPRIGVISKLIGVKRKTPASVLHGTRHPPKTAPWPSSGASKEEWELTYERRDSKEEEELDEEDEDEEEEEVVEEVEEEDPETPLRSRPTTPPPAYLPLGPTLLHTQFQHAYLLPVSTPLRPPGAAVAPVNLAAGGNAHAGGALPSVPTPVSPAAMMGAATERSKSLEMTAAAVASEVVENPVWAETWRATTVGAKASSSVWSGDYKAVAQLLEKVPGLEAPLSMTDLFDLDTPDAQLPDPLAAPKVAVGKGDAVIELAPTALRFWEKLGLDPKGGPKDLVVYVLYEDGGGEQRQTLVDTWLANLSHMYQKKHLGKLSFGRSSMCTRDGHLPVKFDVTLRKTLSSFIASLTPTQPPMALFLVLPLATMSLSSPSLRQVIAAVAKTFSGYPQNKLSLQLVPEQHLFSATERTPTTFNSSLDHLCLSVYDRLPVAVDRVRTATTSNPDEVSEMRANFAALSVTLSRPAYSKVSYVRAVHPSLDVLDRYTLLHVGYHLTSCGRWIIACAIDQRGEDHKVGVWLSREAGSTDHEGDSEMNEDEYAVKKVWDFGMQLARKANVEWRMVFTRLGVITEKELQAWTTCLATHVAPSRSQPPLHHTVCCVVPNAPWFPLSKPNSSNNTPTSPIAHIPHSTRSSTSSRPTSLFVDASVSTYAIYPKNCISMSIPPSQTDLGISQSFIAEPTSSSPIASSPSTELYGSHPATPGIHTDTNSPTSYGTTISALPHTVSLTPQLSSILLQVPRSSSTSTISMIQIHLLHTVHSASYTFSSQASSVSSARVPDSHALLADITNNFHELAVLTKIGRHLDAIEGLPFHLAAVDAMRVALDRNFDHSDLGSDL